MDGWIERRLRSFVAKKWRNTAWRRYPLPRLAGVRSRPADLSLPGIKRDAELFLDNLETWEKIDQLLALCQARRVAILREIDRRRESSPLRIQKLSDDIINGEIEEHRSTSESSGKSEDDRATPLKPNVSRRRGIERVKLNPVHARRSR
jgi:hypothetical protein